MSERRAWGFGLATVFRPEVTEGHEDTEDTELAPASGSVLDTWFPMPALGPAPAGAGQGVDLDPYAVPAALADLAVTDPDRGVVTEVVLADIDLDAAPQDASDAYLRLHLLSHRLAEPNSLNLDGIFAVLANVVWTDRGPCPVEGFEQARLRLRSRGPVQVLGVDKFPRMTDYVVPSGVRIADADRVRLGAHLAAGTTVMHEGFVNFNAGTLGTSMVEGRIGQGIVVDDGSDIGGGASIMGTLSGGGTQRVRIGKRCLLGAEAGLGISLGDDCVVEAGLYVTAGTKLAYHDGGPQPRTVKALELSGRPGLLYRRNSMTGAVEALPRAGLGIELNSVLHAN